MGEEVATAYRRAMTSGPVRFPDGSGRVLRDQVVIGDQWEPLVALGFVERLEGEVAPLSLHFLHLPSVVDPTRIELGLLRLEERAPDPESPRSAA